MTYTLFMEAHYCDCIIEGDQLSQVNFIDYIWYEKGTPLANTLFNITPSVL